jgi:translation elongation factor EF-G
MPPYTYRILPYTRKQARRLGVQVQPSHNKTKKIDVLRKGRIVASVGANGMNDYPTFIQKRGLKFAQNRRRLYKQRHEKDRHIRGSRGWFADQLLW